ncbi:MAG: hypothetical protein IJP45_06960 [Paludibacteraceae bacterium]|nr:hypothetical protein [Paludibacteraceae bacterium]
MKIADNRALVAEKKHYIIPCTESVAFHSGSICNPGSAGGGMTIGGGTLQYGGEDSTIEPM